MMKLHQFGVTGDKHSPQLVGRRRREGVGDGKAILHLEPSRREDTFVGSRHRGQRQLPDVL
ncbi:MAG TPA: hypothetical protein VIN09_01565 [Chloroflexota bacterium]